MTNTKALSPRHSQLEMWQLVMPEHTNPQNTIFGGVVMSWVDLAGAMCATRHAKANVVTVHIDSISFKSPIRIGEQVRIMAMINYVGKSSMLVGVKVIAENPITSESRHTTTAYLTFVALDGVGNPKPVPPLLLENDEDKRRHAEAVERIDLRKKMAKH